MTSDFSIMVMSILFSIVIFLPFFVFPQTKHAVGMSANRVCGSDHPVADCHE